MQQGVYWWKLYSLSSVKVLIHEIVNWISVIFFVDEAVFWFDSIFILRCLSGNIYPFFFNKKAG